MDNKNKTNNILIIALIIAAFVIGFLLNNSKGGSTAQTTTTPTQTAQQPPAAKVNISDVKKLFTADHITFGKPDSKLIFVEISDPSCPYCHVAGGYNPELSAQIDARFKYKSEGGTYVPPVTAMKKLVDQGKAAMVYLYANGHGAGELATQALYCAFDNNKYWEVHSLLYSNSGYELMNQKLEKENNVIKNDKANYNLIAGFLSSVIKKDVIVKCLESGKYTNRLTQDQKLATTLGYEGTPHFLVNETTFKGAYGFTDMQSEVDKYLK